MIDDSWFKEIFINALEKKKPFVEYSEAEIKDIYRKSINQFAAICRNSSKEIKEMQSLCWPKIGK